MSLFFLKLASTLFLIGLFFFMLEKTPYRLGSLPGDWVWSRENFSFFFPLASCVVISILVNFLILLWRRW